MAYPDEMFLDFIKSFLEHKGFDVQTAPYATEAYTACNRMVPDLIVVHKAFPDLDAKGFLIKKRISEKIKYVPVFLTGDFSPEEIVYYKKELVQSFVSVPLNPVALHERILHYFKIPMPAYKKTTPMLMDIHVKGSIIMVQIEGNFEADKLELCNYLIRAFCKQRKIHKPKLMFIIPSLYPESITEENLRILFKCGSCPELEVKDHNIQLLTRHKQLITCLRKTKGLPPYDITASFLEGISILQIDFDKRKSVPVEFLKKDSMYVFDLYDKTGKKYIPALTKVSEAMLSVLQEAGIRHLTYYSDKNLAEVKGSQESTATPTNQRILFDFITRGFEPIETELQAVEVWDEKKTLFFRNMKGQEILVVTDNLKMKQLMQETLGIYFNITLEESGEDFETVITAKSYSIVFLDSDMRGQDTLGLLVKIRTLATRRRTTVIILANRIDKSAVMHYKQCGTDNILLFPFSNTKVLQTVFLSVNADRRT